MADTGFQKPTIQALITRISDDLNAQIPGEDARIRRSFLYVLARVLAGVAWLLYGAIAWAIQQIFPDTGTDDTVRRWASIFGLTAVTATKAAGDVGVAGTNGTILLAGATLQAADGTEVVTTADVTISGGVGVVAVIAVVAGAAGNLDTGTVLTLLSPVAGINTDGNLVQSPGLIGGTDAETRTALQTRLLDRMSATPQGGAVADYIAWAKAALSTVDQVWVRATYPNAGDVTVYFTVTWDGSDPSSIVPSVGDVSQVQAYIDNLAPVGATIYVAAPIASAVTLSIQLDDNTADEQSQVNAELDAMFQREVPPSGVATAFTLRNGKLQAAIGRAQETYALLDVNGDGTGNSDVPTAVGVVSYRGAVTYS